VSQLRLRHVAEVNPPCAAWDRLPDDAELTFVPLEAVWPRRVDVSRVRTKAETATGYTRFQQGDVLVPKITPTFEADRSTWIEHIPTTVATGTTELHVVRARPGVEPRYLDYLFSSTPFLRGGEAEMIGVAGQKRVPDSWLRDFPVPINDLAEQRAIADYLDAETARIDALIAKKQQLIHLLEERYSAAREQLLTRPRGESLVPSRTGFFAEVPERWEETTLRHLGVEVQTGPFGSQLHAEEYVEGGWPVVNPANLRDGRIRRIDSMTITDAKRDELSRHILREGDIVFGRRGEMGRAGLVGQAEAGWICGTGSLRLRVASQRLDPGYLAELLQINALRNYFTLMSVGSTMDNLNSEIVLSMPCLVPSSDRQRTLVEELAIARADHDSLADRLVRQIHLLGEHREALVTRAVQPTSVASEQIPQTHLTSRLLADESFGP
jgi:type I restriction enzyme S subunit